MDDRIRFAPTDESEPRAARIQRFLRAVLGLEWAFVSDRTTLADFDGVIGDDELRARVRAEYGTDPRPADRDVPLYALVDALEAARERRDAPPN